jgi:opacity protein-like surface antigen
MNPTALARSRFPLAFLLLGGLLVARPGQAQEQRFQLFAGVEPGFTYSEVAGFESHNGFRLGLGYDWTPTFALELSSAVRELTDYDSRVVDGAVLFRPRSSGAWRPYLGGGLHHFAAEADRSAFQDESGLGLLLAAGVDWRFGSRFSLRLDARYAPVDLSGDRALDSDLLSWVGLGWRF